MTDQLKLCRIVQIESNQVHLIQQLLEPSLTATCGIYVTLHGKTDTNAFPFKLQNCLLSV